MPLLELNDTQPLRVHWWRDVPNFGDILASSVVKYVSGRDVVWSRTPGTHVFAIGSIASLALRGSVARGPKNSKPVIWGIGCMTARNIPELSETAEIVAVRGPLTAAQLGQKDLVTGDPGILACEVLGLAPKPRTKIGIIPHWKMMGALGIEEYLENSSEAVVINPMREPSLVAEQISSCDIVVSSSLHGLIVADSYGVPNTWLEPSNTHPSPRHKFHDYALSVGRELPTPIKISELSAFLKAPKQPKFDYMEEVRLCKKRLFGSFPYRLRTQAAKKAMSVGMWGTGAQ